MLKRCFTVLKWCFVVYVGCMYVVCRCDVGIMHDLCMLKMEENALFSWFLR